MEPQDDVIQCKIIIIGDYGVGKTSLMNKFCKGSFFLNPPTVAPNVQSRRLQIFDKTVNMMIWDTAGQERYFAITKLYFRQAMGALFVYDVTRPETLLNMEKWFNIVTEETSLNLIQILVGHKCDEENKKQISTKEGKAVADHFGMLFCEVSSKENIHVDTVFCLIASMVVELNWDTFFTQPSNGFVLNNEEDQQNNSMCFINSIYNWFKF